MIPAAFAYQRPASIEEALAIIGSDPGAKLLAGGQSLLPLLKLRLGSAETLVDIGRLPGLVGVRQLDDGRLAIGALTTYAELLESPAAEYGLLRDALPHIGDVQVRNLGTVGGSIAHADPASDLPACLLALEAELVIRSAERRADDAASTGSSRAPFTTGLEPGEILTEIRMPGRRDDAGFGLRHARAAGVGVRHGRRRGGRLLERFGRDRRGERRPDRCRARWPTGPAPSRPRSPARTDRRRRSPPPPRTPPMASRSRRDIHADRAYRTAMAAVYTRRAIEAALARLR